MCALRHLIHIVLLGYLLCYSVRCYIQVRPSSCPISIFPANPALAALAWQIVIGRRQLGAKSKVGAPVSNLTVTLLTLLLIRELNARQKTERLSSVSALSGRRRCSLLLATVFPRQSIAAINRLPYTRQATAQHARRVVSVQSLAGRLHVGPATRRRTTYNGTIAAVDAPTAVFPSPSSRDVQPLHC